MAKSKFFINLSRGSSTVEEHLTRNHMLKGLNPASGTVREKMAKSKIFINLSSGSSTVEEHAIHIHMTKSLNPASGTVRELKWQKASFFYKLVQGPGAVAQWKNTRLVIIC